MTNIFLTVNPCRRSVVLSSSGCNVDLWNDNNLIITRHKLKDDRCGELQRLKSLLSMYDKRGWSIRIDGRESTDCAKELNTLLSDFLKPNRPRDTIGEIVSRRLRRAA
jgi:hypothetical protein